MIDPMPRALKCPAAGGVLVGVAGFAAVVFAAPLESAALFRVGTVLIGFGNGLFAVGTLTSAMALERAERSGLGPDARTLDPARR